jgi:ArsR family metal-binding transcriptional regulator
MLLKSFRKEIFRPECNPNFQSLHCLAHLDQDVGPALPYLNAHLGGFEYHPEPPAVTLRVQGKLITVHGDRIAINALRDEAEADKILEWLRREINQCWEDRAGIEPCFEGAPRPKLIEVLKLLPRTNCGECGRPTCMVFAAEAVEGVRGAKDCPPLSPEQAGLMDGYLGRFNLEEVF